MVLKVMLVVEEVVVYPDGSVTTALLADKAVTGAKIDGA